MIMKNNQEYFEVAKEYKIPLTGYYNVFVYECQKCDHNMIDELHDHIIGFADSSVGIVKVIECPKCFEKFYCHASESDYWHFLWEIERGKQKHFNIKYINKIQYMEKFNKLRNRWIGVIKTLKSLSTQTLYFLLEPDDDSKFFESVDSFKDCIEETQFLDFQMLAIEYLLEYRKQNKLKIKTEPYTPNTRT